MNTRVSNSVKVRIRRLNCQLRMGVGITRQLGIIMYGS